MIMISYQELRRQLHYDPETGVFIRIAQTDHKNCRLGKPLGWKQVNRYLMIVLGRRKYYAHRLAWFYMFGKWPREIDHIDRDRTNNRIANLREVTRRQNNLNAKLSCRNKSGVRGVGWFARDGLWRASIYINEKNVNLGHFTTVELAKAARRTAEAIWYKPFAGRTEL
jgi:hypothetical protein